MSLAGAAQLIGYQPSQSRERELIAAWILKTDVEDLAELVLKGVNLDHPPPELFCKPPQGGSVTSVPKSSTHNRFQNGGAWSGPAPIAAGPIPGATPMENGTVIR